MGKIEYTQIICKLFLLVVINYSFEFNLELIYTSGFFQKVEIAQAALASVI